MQSKPVSSVEPTLLEFEPGDAEHLFNHLQCVLVTVLGVNALARGKSHSQSDVLQGHRLSSQALQKDFHSRTQWVPFCYVAERGQIEIAAELSIQPHQDVLVELGGDAS